LPKYININGAILKMLNDYGIIRKGDRNLKTHRFIWVEGCNYKKFMRYM
jgi:hypothetical protein